MKKQTILKKTKKRLNHIFDETNIFAYVALLIFFIGLSFFSLRFDERTFTVLSSLGCGGIASVIVAWLIENSNNRIIKHRNKATINQLLYEFDNSVTIECQRALQYCAKYQDFDIEKDYTISEIKNMLQHEKCEAVFFQGFPRTFDVGMKKTNAVTLLSFDQSDLGRNLYDLFITLKSTLQTITNISEINTSKEFIKILVIQSFELIDGINNLRDKKITYYISDSDKEYIKSFRAAIVRKQNNK